MKSCWHDVVIFRICIGLGEGHFPAYARARGLLARVESELLSVMDDLNNLSILLLVLTFPAGSALHEAAAAEYLRRELPPHAVWATLREALPPYLTDFEALGQTRGPRQQALLHLVHETLYVPALTTYLARVAMVDSVIACLRAAPWPRRILAQTQIAPHADSPLSMDDGFLVALYRDVMTTSWPIADRWPEADHPPSWVATIDPEEVCFLDRCLERLPPERRALLYLSLYAQLNVRQITAVLRANIPDLLPEEVVRWLCDAWEAVLDC
jgi:hypothetical protein